MIVLSQHEKDILHSKKGLREIKFQYDLLDGNNIYKKTLTNVIDCTIDYKSLNNIKRTARIQLKEDLSIDYLNDRIQPYMLAKDGNSWLKYSLGIFLLNSPVQRDNNHFIERDITCYDLSQMLLQDRLTDRMLISAGTNYIYAINDILIKAGITHFELEPTLNTLQTDREFEIDKDKLSLINELLTDINYTSLYVDENGVFKADKYIPPVNREAEYEYKTDYLSIIYNGLTSTLDLFNVPNTFTIVVTNPDQEPLKASYANNNINSSTSLINRNRTISYYEEIDNIGSQAELDEYVKRVATRQSNIYGHLEFETALMPQHGYLNFLQVQYSKMGVNDKYIETNWNMQLKAGGKMKHKVRKVVTV